MTARASVNGAAIRVMVREARPSPWSVMGSWLAVVLVLLAGCLSSSVDSVESATGADNGGCPAGEQPVFGPGADLICSPIPHWPPAQTGSRAVPAACALLDGTYHVTWHPDIAESLRPAFSVTTALTIASDELTLDLGARPDWTYRYSLDWIDSASANVWEPGSTDTWEFWIALDCQSGEIRGSYTVTLPYYNPGHQVATWTLRGTP